MTIQFYAFVSVVTDCVRPVTLCGQSTVYNHLKIRPKIKHGMIDWRSESALSANLICAYISNRHTSKMFLSLMRWGEWKWGRELEFRSTGRRQSENTLGMVGIFWNFKADPVTHLFQRGHFSWSEQFHQLGSKYSDVWVRGGHFHPNHHTCNYKQSHDEAGVSGMQSLHCVSSERGT